ncbi:MAG: nucleotidyltransferase domain-containing protein [Bacteroidales bacterium]|nr:nucleotidyltransferase domain-containing protein [Bacteroidales bacterium]
MAGLNKENTNSPLNSDSFLVCKTASGRETRGDARPDSDIDLLILFNKPTVDGKNGHNGQKLG